MGVIFLSCMLLFGGGGGCEGGEKGGKEGDRFFPRCKCLLFKYLSHISI